MGITVERYKLLMSVRRSPISFEEARSGVGNRGGSGSYFAEVAIENMLRYDGSQPEHVTEANMLKGSVGNLLGTLLPCEQDAIRMRFGLDGSRPKTLQEVGKSARCSR